MVWFLLPSYLKLGSRIRAQYGDSHGSTLLRKETVSEGLRETELGCGQLESSLYLIPQGTLELGLHYGVAPFPF